MFLSATSTTGQEMFPIHGAVSRRETLRTLSSYEGRSNHSRTSGRTGDSPASSTPV